MLSYKRARDVLPGAEGGWLVVGQPHVAPADRPLILCMRLGNVDTHKVGTLVVASVESIQGRDETTERRSGV